MKRIGIYLRVSTEEQARIQEGSLVTQRKRLEEYVEGQNRREANWGTIIDFYCDEGKSAKDMNRPQFQRLLSDIKIGKVNLILSTELSRLSRSVKDFCELWELFKKHSSSFITLKDNFDSTTAAGEMMVFNMINFAQFERKQTAERISANFKSRAERGLWNGGTIPLGFDRNPKNPSELLHNPEEAKQVKAIFELFLKSGSVRKTCLLLSKKGMFSKKYINKYGLEKGGGHFTVPSMQRILSNQAYIGLREMGVSKGNIKVVPANWKPILDLDLFNRVQERLSLNRNKYKPEEWKKYPYPLTELLICGECGKHLGGKSAHGAKAKHHYYEHPRQIHTNGINHLKRCQMERVRAGRLEDVLLTSLKKLINDPKLIDHWINIYQKNTTSELPAMEARLKTIETDIQTQNKRLQNLVLRLSDLPKEIPADTIYEQIQELTKKKKDFELTKEQMKSQRNQLSTQIVNRDQLFNKIQRSLQNIEKVPVESRRPIYSNLLKYAELYPTKVKLGLYAPTISNFTDFGLKPVCSTNLTNGARDWT